MSSPYQMPGCIYRFAHEPWCDLYFTLGPSLMIEYHTRDFYFRFSDDKNDFICYETSRYNDILGPGGIVTLIIE